MSSSSQGSSLEDFETLGDVLIWGEGAGDGFLGGGKRRIGKTPVARTDSLLPKVLESATMLDVQNIVCGHKHAVLLTKQGEAFSWGEGLGGRLGHGVELDVSNPKPISALRALNTELIACGEYHSCAVTLSGDLYTWGDCTHNIGLLGHESEVGHWTPKKVHGLMGGVHISSISCGPWHTAAVTMEGQLFTFGDGTFGALGHGDHSSTNVPSEVITLKGLRTLKVACGFWHTAAIVDVMAESASSDGSNDKKLFTWGDGDRGQLGHGDKEPRLIPSCVAYFDETNFCQVACGHSITIALATSGRVYTMGSADYGQLGNPGSSEKFPTCVEGKLINNIIEEISCGSYHVAVLSSKSEVYTWGKGANGQLGHGDNDDRNTPTLVEALRDRRVKNVVCGSNFTAVICFHKWVCPANNSLCSGCHNPFNLRRKRHNCYNCGQVFCKICTSQKSLKASLAPTMKKPYRVCDDCFKKLKTTAESGSTCRLPKKPSGNLCQTSSDVEEKETLDSKAQHILSRLPSFDSFKRASSRKPRQNIRPDSNNPSSSSNARSVKCGRSSMLTPTVSFPALRLNSQAPSPVSRISSPHPVPHVSPLTAISNPEVVLDDTKQKNDGLKEEIAILSLKVENLTCKSQRLEAELKRTSKLLEEATTLAREEADKNRAAEEIIKSLRQQLDALRGETCSNRSE
ncbi:hypothetical protein NMG60_11009611 [Bertholletia excelsa]